MKRSIRPSKLSKYFSEESILGHYNQVISTYLFMTISYTMSNNTNVNVNLFLDSTANSHFLVPTLK